MTPLSNWLFSAWSKSIPSSPIKSTVEWARKHVVLVGSVLGETFNPDKTPWTKEPIECTDNGTRKGTFVKPIQCGGSQVGIIGILKRLATAPAGDIQYNWPNGDKAKEKWAKEIEKKLKACKPVMARTGEEFVWRNGLVAFPHCNLTVQGVFTDTKLTSDPIVFQVNEELHDEDGGWSPGRLEQAYGRLTAVWNGTAFNISNAGKKGGELHAAFDSGTRQYWEVKCPGCGLFHAMRTRWEPKEPQLGGLRYDSDGCKREDGTFDYLKLESSLRFQMPCGYAVHEDVRERRALSLSGKYSEPTNKGAPLTEKSWTLEAVSIDYIPWISLVQQKHKALQAMKWGDPELWWTYLRERECQFANSEDRPTIHRIVLSDRKKDREGLPKRVARLGAADRQQGSQGEFPHWWALIQDAETLPDGRLHVLTVFEGKILTDEDLIDLFNRHEVKPSAIALDSGWDTDHVYEICMKHGYTALKGEETQLFSHGDGVRKIFEPEKPLHAMINMPPVYPYKLTKILTSGQGEYAPDPREPMFIRYSQGGVMDRLAWLRSSKMVVYEVPSDVSEDFISHMDSWSKETRKVARTGQEVGQWVQHKTRDDIYFCACYIGLFLEMAALIGAGVIEQQDKK